MSVTRGKSSRLHLWAVAIGLCLLPACSGTIETADFSSFSKAAGDVATQADLSFVESNKLARRVAVDRFVRSGDIALAEAKFSPAITREDMLAWQEALSNLQRYGTVIGSLVDSSRGADMSAALGDLGQELQGGLVNASIDPGLGAAFSALGGALVDAKAQRSARAIIETADPHVQAVTSMMAQAIGSSDSEGLRGTVYSNWTASLNGPRAAYPAAAQGRDERLQRSLVAEYILGLDQRDAQLRSLANLRSSILALGAAHGAAKAGSPAGFNSILSEVEVRLDETQRIYSDLNDADQDEGRRK